MSLKLFIDAVCPTGEHCAFCRDRERGRGFRESMARSFVLPDGAPDFDCPSGHAWGSTPTKPVPKPITSRLPPPASEGQIEAAFTVERRTGGCGCAGGHRDVRIPK